MGDNPHLVSVNMAQQNSEFIAAKPGKYVCFTDAFLQQA